MSNQSPYGYTEESSFKIHDGEIVRCILLERYFPIGYFKELEKTNLELKQKSEEFGTSYEPILATYKDGGIAWSIAIISRKKNETDWSKTIKELDDGTIELPNYNICCTFQHIPPQIQLKVISGNNYKYGDLYREGGGSKFIKGNLEIINLTPSVNSCRDNTNKKIPYHERITADNIPVGRESQFDYLLAEEATRVREWKTIIEKWNTITENDRLNLLEECIARRLLICAKEENKVYYLPLEPGIVFETSIEQGVNSKSQFNLKSIENWRKDSNNNFKRDIHSSFNCKVPSEKYKLLAKEILKAREIKIKEYRDRKVQPDTFDYGANKMNVIESTEENEIEEDPF